jgi:hypothetical protein
MAIDHKESDEQLETSPKLKKEGKVQVDKVIINNLSKLVTYPPGYIKSEAINVYSDRWRVNIWTVGDNNARVEGSWFVVADPKGAVVSFN